MPVEVRRPSEADAAVVRTGQERVWFAQAIRGPACLLVVATHLGYLFWANQPLVAAIGHFPALDLGDPGLFVQFYERLVDWHLYIGSFAPCLFFLVSGFVLPYALERGTLGSFFVRRFFRLYPTLWVCLALNVAVVWIQARHLGDPFPYGARELGGDAFLVSPYLRALWVEPVLWTLAVEELFYLLAAFVSWKGLLARRGVVLGMVAGLSVVALVGSRTEVGGPFSWLAFNATFVIFVLVGTVFHQVYRGRWILTDGAAMVVVMMAAFELALHHGAASPVGRDFAVSAPAALLVFGAVYWARDRIPEWRALDYLGDITYPLYIVHALNGYIVMRAVWVATESYWLSISASLAAIVLAAVILHHLVDKPTNDFGRRVGRRMRARSAAPIPAVVPAPAPVAPAG